MLRRVSKTRARKNSKSNKNSGGSPLHAALRSVPTAVPLLCNSDSDSDSSVDMSSLPGTVQLGVLSMFFIPRLNYSMFTCSLSQQLKPWLSMGTVSIESVYPLLARDTLTLKKRVAIITSNRILRSKHVSNSFFPACWTRLCFLQLAKCWLAVAYYTSMCHIEYVFLWKLLFVRSCLCLLWLRHDL